MLERLSHWLLRVLRVSPEPSVPAGGRVIRVFRAAPGYYRYRSVLWGLGQLVLLLVLLAALLVVIGVQREAGSNPRILLWTFAALATLVYVVQLPLSFAALRLGMDMRWYVLSERSLRIREGVLTVREKTMTFANIQQITIQQNPLERMLGIANVQVRSAGGGAGGSGGSPGAHGGGGIGEGMHQAFFRGVDNAEEIRDAVRERVRLTRNGRDEDAEPRTADVADQEASVPPALAAARLLRDEMRQLREAVASAG